MSTNPRESLDQKGDDEITSKEQTRCERVAKKIIAEKKEWNDKVYAYN